MLIDLFPESAQVGLGEEKNCSPSGMTMESGREKFILEEQKGLTAEGVKSRQHLWRDSCKTSTWAPGQEILYFRSGWNKREGCQKCLLHPSALPPSLKLLL